MSERLNEFPAGTQVVVVTFSRPDLVADYADLHDSGFPVLIDSTRATYAAYGLKRGSALRVWGWRAARNYAEILWRQRSLRALRAPNEDTLQLGGDFIVGADGNLGYAFWGDGPDDRPSVDDMLGSL